MTIDRIVVRGASEHNLKSVDVEIPREALTVVTGVSGSGKSSLAFDTICAEGRRRYLETFSSYARQFLGKLSRPAVAGIDGLSPAVAVDQSTLARNPRSTVGTMTELYDVLRLLWARVGAAPAGVEAPKPERRLFSFNSPHGACPACRGLGVEDRLDPELLVARPDKSIREGALRLTTPTGYLIYSQVTIDVLDQVCRAHGFSVDVPWQALTTAQRDVILNGSDRIRIPFGKHPLESRLRWSGITPKPREEGVYRGILPVMEQILRHKRNRSILRFVRSLPCRACGGTRLRPEALAVAVSGLTIAQAAAFSIDELRAFFGNGVRHNFAGKDAAVFEHVREQAIDRIGILRNLGLGYLSLDRESTTLAGGEVQRIKLARQAGIGLGGVLYVLDEPTIGLHHRDTRRLLDVLRLIRNRGNTLLVVEHDEQVVRSADWIVDVGPAAGRTGGEVLYCGPAAQFVSGDTDATEPPRDTSRTRAFLTGAERIPVPDARRAGTGALAASGITKHNLRNVTVEFKAGAFNAVTGVSGAGKSTLIEELARLWRAGTGRGADLIDKIIEIDQAPIGRTPRSNPATYTGLFDHVRDLFAAQPEAVRRRFGKGRFSFNVKGGRCESCEGAGVQQVGMQFLGTVNLVCDACAGRRFSDDTLEIRYRGKDIHDVLEMPIEEAAEFFADQPAVHRSLATMEQLGLGYLALGHPATMLAGGEAQRVKLAAELARPGTGRTLYLLDEPTTGLHAADLVPLLAAINGLVGKGNTVIAIEHNLDVIKVADWVVDLGPGSGADGGKVVAAGTPETVAAAAGSFTGEALREALGAVRASTELSTNGQPLPAPAPRVDSVRSVAPEGRRDAQPIRLTNVTTHNLQHVDVEIPKNKITVVTGVSGSGKSSLAFDTIFAEGQQRFAESFSTYARRFLQRASEAEFDEASGLTPAVAISQHAPSRNPRSTVGTLTEIHDYYRLLFARAGTRFCPRCAPTPAALVDGTCPACGFKGARALTASMFSQNSEQGACLICHGLGFRIGCDPARLITDPTRPLVSGAMSGHRAGRFYGDPRGQHMAILAAAGQALGVDFARPWSDLDERTQALVLDGAGDRVFEVEWNYLRGKRRGVHRFQSRWEGLLEYVRREYERKHADRRGEELEPLMTPVRCADCGGGKLKAEFLAVRFAGLNIRELQVKTVGDTLLLLASIASGALAVGARAFAITEDLRAEVARRLTSLRDAGLDYLTLDRPAVSLSGGEAQRVRLASQLRSGLTGITYVLDEPTIGLHRRDTSRLIALLRGLRDAGNTIVVVEHDIDVIGAADHILEIGPGAGDQGGQLIAQGPPAIIERDSSSRTGRCLREAARSRVPATRRPLKPGLSIRGATVHNLRDLDVDVPAGGLVAITGVSGSGKSSLVFDVLAPSIERIVTQPARALGASTSFVPSTSPLDIARGDPGRVEGSKTENAGRPVEAPVNCDAVILHTPFRAINLVGQASVGSSPWSTPATHTDVFDHIRDLFARTDAARVRGLRKRDFSTLGKGGRCEACEGLGQTRVSMDFLPDVWTTCEDCGGKRYRPDVLACEFEGRSIADVLAMTIDEARALFAGHATIEPALSVLHDVGLGYVRLGQPARTLSGGERQRLVLATALLDRDDGPRLYLFDEPTTGLHADDVVQLLGVFDRLIDAGHSLVVIEHNPDLIAKADWVLDLGPEGGNAGGRLVAAGPPEAMSASPESHTGRALNIDLVI